jgi:hypothetical protein
VTSPPPPPAAWKGTPAQYHALMNTAGFTWNPQTAAWKYRATEDDREHPDTARVLRSVPEPA